MIYQSKFAEKSIRKIATYITNQGNPNNAINYIAYGRCFHRPV